MDRALLESWLSDQPDGQGEAVAPRGADLEDWPLIRNPEAAATPAAKKRSPLEDFMVRERERDAQRDREDRRTIPGHVWEGAKGVPRGLAGMAAGAMQGAQIHADNVRNTFREGAGDAPLRRRSEDGAIYKAGLALIDAAQEVAPLDPDYEGAMTVQTGEAVGSLAGFAIPGGAVGAAARRIAMRKGATAAGAQTAARAGQFGTAAPLAASAGTAETYERALEFAKANPELGITERDIQSLSTTMGPLAGVVQIATLGPLFRHIPEPAKKRSLTYLVRRMAEAGITEFTVENAGQVIQNLAEQTYSPDHPLWDEVPERGEPAAYAAALLQAVMFPFLRTGSAPASRRRSSQVPPASQAAADMAGQTRDEDDAVDLDTLYNEEVGADPEAELQDLADALSLISQEAAPDAGPSVDAHTASVPTMITHSMRQRLGELGYQDGDIRKLRLQDAWNIINNKKTRPKPSKAPPRAKESVLAESDADGPALNVQEVPLAEITLSQDVPQFKAGADTDTGVVEPLEGSYDRLGASPILVWEREDGRKEVITGRHRLDLARRSGEQTIPAQVVREADGFSIEDALTADAELNIRDNQGSTKDYATYFKTRGLSEGDAQSRGLLSRAKGRDGFAIASQGSETLFQLHASGQITDAQAAGVARAAPGNERLQSLGLQQIQQGRTIEAATSLMDAVSAMRAEGQGSESGDLFGFDDSAMRQAEQLASAATSRKRAISEQLAAVRGAAKRPEKAKALGVDVRDPEGLNKRIAELEAESRAWDQWPTNPALRQELMQDIEGAEPADAPPATESAEPSLLEQAPGQVAQEAPEPEGPPPQDLFGEAPVKEQALFDAQNAVDDRLGGGEAEAPAAGGLFDADAGAQVDVTDVAGDPRSTNIEDARAYAAEVVGKGGVSRIWMVGSALTSPTPRDVDLLYEITIKGDLPLDADAAQSAVETLIEQTSIDLDRYDTFVRIAPKGGSLMGSPRYFHVATGVGRGVVENTSYAEDQAGRDRELLASARVEPVDVPEAAGEESRPAAPEPGAATADLGGATRPLVQRQESARRRFIDAAVEQFGLTEQQAEIALDELQKVNLVKLDPNSGQFNLKTGAVWERDVMLRAVAKREDFRPRDGWRQNLIKAREYADHLGIDTQGKKLPALLAEIDTKTGERTTHHEIVEHVTKRGKGKTIRGVVRTDMTQDEAKAIDPYTFKKDGGWFIRERHLDELPPTSVVDAAAAEADTSPSEAQIEAGNYKKGHIALHGLDIAIENPRGSTRSGTNASGRQWQTTMAHHYGYIKRTEGRDGDHVDVFLGPDAEDANLPVFVIDQVKPGNRNFDEHKVMIGFADEAAAREGYLSSYESGWQGLGSITETTLDGFKAWLAEADTTQRFADSKGADLTQHGTTITLQEPLTVYHGTAEGVDFDAFDADRAGSGVGGGAFDQGNQFYVTRSRRAAEWFSRRAEEHRQNRQPGAAMPDLRPGSVLEFSLPAGSRILRVDAMPRMGDGASLLQSAREAGYDAVEFADPGFATIEGDPEVAAILNEEGAPATLVMLNHAAAKRQKPRADKARLIPTRGEDGRVEYRVDPVDERLPIEDDRERQRKENVRKLAALKADDPLPPVDIPEGISAKAVELTANRLLRRRNLESGWENAGAVDRIEKLTSSKKYEPAEPGPDDLDAYQFGQEIGQQIVQQAVIDLVGNPLKQDVARTLDESDKRTKSPANTLRRDDPAAEFLDPAAAPADGPTGLRRNLRAIGKDMPGLKRDAQKVAPPKKVAELREDAGALVALAQRIHAVDTSREPEGAAEREFISSLYEDMGQTLTRVYPATTMASRVIPLDLQLERLRAFEKLAAKHLSPEEAVTQPAGDVVAELQSMSDEQFLELFDKIEAEVGAAETEAPLSQRGRTITSESGETKPRRQKSKVELEKDPGTEEATERGAAEIAKSAGVNLSNAGKNALKGLDELFGGPGRMNSGLSFDSETYAKAKPHFEQMLKDFQAAGKDVAELIRTMIERYGSGVRPYALQFARDQREQQKPITQREGPEASESANLIGLFAEYFSDPTNGFRTITNARGYAETILGRAVKPGTADAKMVDEAIESGVVQAAREIVKASRQRGPAATYRRLVDLYGRQPNLSTRTSTSVAQQAYSTPVPLAYLAGELAGIDGNTKVYEPTAGNGALVIAADPTNVTANELNADRSATLANTLPGARVTSHDASTWLPEGSFDVVIANPPFGTVRGEDGSNRRFQVDGRYETGEIDHAIAMKSLEAMEDDGRAVLIVGSVAKTARGEEARSDAYNAKAKREFYLTLYGAYNVVDHFTVSGDLYAKQGAGWPVDVIVIQGRGKSQMKVPAANPPRQYDSWDALSEVFDGRTTTQDRSPRGTDARATGERTEPSRSDAGDRGTGRAEGSRGQRSDARSGEPGAVRPGSVDGQPDAARPAQSEPRQPAESGRDRDRAGTARPDAVTPPAADARQRPYKPGSTATSLNTLVPVNMQESIQQALARFKTRHGDIDSYVADRLGYDADQLSDYFGAEQVDAIALGLDNMERGAGFIIGDQTGIGKGRVVAAMIRYALRAGRTPIFVTEKPNLYGDMFRDLNDIGVQDMLGRSPQILMTNAAATVPLDESGTVLKTGAAAAHNNLLTQIAESGRLDGYDMVFTTYSQMQTLKGEETARMRFLDAIGQGGIVIFDESHNAGGTGGASDGQSRGPKAGEDMNRATFARKLAMNGHGVFYSSATYAKRPDVMDLYATTDMRLAVSDISNLAEAIRKGGVPMQQAVASMLTGSGQYVRRERSFDGIQYNSPTVKVSRDTYSAYSDALAMVQDFSERFVKGATKGIDKELKAEGKALNHDGSTGGAGASSTNFTSIMHNLIDQMLLSIKADRAADTAIEAIERGEKPVITVANTMGSFIQDYAEETNTRSGERMTLTFNSLLERYLERSRRITIRTPFMKKGQKGEQRQLTDNELGPAGVRAYKEYMAFIRGLDLGDLPVSPIDHIHHRLREAGHKSSEITGRTATLDYRGDGTYYQLRPTKDSSIAGRRKAIAEFNDGTIDAMIINQAGSTGLSLHASEKFKDQRKRRMIIAQAEKNIDTHMQMLGRVHRTGQVVLPEYDQLVADVPAEKRPAAVLAKKMASLNANTTAARDSALKAKDVPDFMNEYGDEVAARVMSDFPDLHIKIGSPLKETSDGYESADAMRKVTGRIPLLSVADQEALYETLESEYDALLQQKEAAGESVLEAKTLNLDPRNTERTQVIAPQDGDSPFADGVYVEISDVRRLGKPHTSQKVREMVAEELGMEVDAVDAASMSEQGRAAARRLVSETEEAVKAYRQEVLDELTGEKARDALEDRLSGQWDRFRAILRTAHLGAPVVLKTSESNLYGVVIKVHRTGKAKNPTALGTWKVTVALADASRQITLPMSQLYTNQNSPSAQTGSAIIVEPSPKVLGTPMLDAFDEMQTDSRERRTIITGNMLAGFDHVGGRGTIINFLDQGKARQGILMPKDYDYQAAQSGRSVPFRSADQVVTFAELGHRVTSSDRAIEITVVDGKVRIEITAAKSRGGKYFLDRALIDAVGHDFVTVGNKMRADVIPSRARPAIDQLKRLGAGLEATSELDEARQIAGSVVGASETQSPAPDEPAKFSRSGETAGAIPDTGNRPSAAAIQDAVAEIALTWEHGPFVDVVESWEQLPVHLRDQVESAGAYDAAGVYDDSSGQPVVYLIADQIRSLTHARKTLAHEAVGHYGMETLLGDEYGDVLDRVRHLKRSDPRIKKIAEGVRRAYGSSINESVEASEIIAKMAEEHIRHPLMTRIHAAIRRFLRRLGFRVPFTATELDAMIVRAERMLVTGRGQGRSDGRTPRFQRGRSRVDMNFKEVRQRVPELQEAAQRLQAGELTKEQYAEIVNQYKPVEPYTEVPAVSSEADMQRALSSNKVDRIGSASASLEAGHPVGLRIDIPAYSNHGVWVVSVHEQTGGFNAGRPIGYESVAAATGVEFGAVQKAALNIAAGKPKGTIAVMKGAWKPMTPTQARAAAKEALKDEAWTQVGMDPERHAFFFDRATMRPVVSADEVIQVGPLALAKNAVFGDLADFAFSRSGDRSVDQTDTPEFKRWFGDSKVVDDQGRPMVVNHATFADFNEFDFGRLGEVTDANATDSDAPIVQTSRLGGWFSERDVSKDVGATRNYQAHLSIENPKRYRSLDEIVEEISEHGGSGQALKEALESEGFDGIIVADEEFRTTSYVAFSPEQIRRVAADGSARFSRGIPPDLDGADAMERQANAQKLFAKGQPIDRMFRIPFDVMGLVDSAGRLKAGVKIEAAAKRALMQSKFKPDGMLGWMNPMIESARAGLIDRYGLDAAFTQREMEAKSDEARILSAGEAFLKRLADAKVGPAEARALQAILTGEAVGDDAMNALAAPIREAIDQLGQEMVALGLLEADTYQRHVGTYLHRSYMKHQQQLEGLPKWAHSVLSKHRRKLHGDELRARGLKEDVDTTRLLRDAPGDWWGSKLKAGEADKRLRGTEWLIFDRLTPIGEGTDTAPGIEEGGPRKRRRLQRVFWPADQAVPARFQSWANRGKWEVTGTKGTKLRLRRDFTKAEREAMGEILDARYNLIKTYQLMAHDVANGRFFRDIAKNPDWSVAEAKSGETVANAEQARRLSTFTGVDWVRVPSTKIGDTGKMHWGDLGGRLVRPEIWRDLNELDRMQKPGTWRAILTQWKTNKTARSPVVHMNNVMSNLVLMDLIDVRLSDLVRGIQEYRSRGEMFREAREHGAFGAGFVQQELRRNHVDPMLDEIMKEARNTRDDVEGRTRLLSKLAYGLWDAAKKGDRTMTNFYQTEDELFRMATYMRHRGLGASAQEAATIAREQFLNYDIRAPWVNALRETVLPFISYTYRAVPAIATAIAHRPWKIAKYSAIGYLANLMAYELAPGDEDEERRTMRDAQQGTTWASVPFTDIGVHRMVRLPLKDQHDNPLFLDVFRWIPAGDVFDTNQGQIGLPAWFQFGGPMQLGFEIALNRSAFTGRDIVDRQTDTGSEAAQKRIDYLWKAWMPSAAYVPGSWHYDKLESALKGERDMLGRPYSVPSALLSGVGVKAQPHDVQLGYYFRGSEIQRKMRALRSQARQVSMDEFRNIGSDESRKRELEIIQRKMRDLDRQQRALQGRE